MSRTE